MMGNWGRAAKRRARKRNLRPIRISLKASSLWPLFGIGVLLGAAALFARLSVEEVADARNQLNRVIDIQDGKLLAVEEKRNSGQDEQESVVGSTGSEGSDGGKQGDAQAQDEVRDTGVNGKNEDDAGSLEGVKENVLSNEKETPSIKVYVTKERRVETIPLEEYVLGVLAGEMPADFELEALKAQAIAARTYIVRRLSQLQQGIGDAAPAGADVTDTVTHQVYVSKSMLADKWSGEEDKEANLAKLTRAVEETKGLIVTYGGEPILASFFSTSNGYTENSEDYWEQSLPYLRSVDSPWDIGISPRYTETIVFTREELYSKLGLTGKQAKKKLSMKVVEKTEGNRVGTIRINGKEYSGREIRERLGLASSQFTWKSDKTEITITTYGYGHGVGMSQWGANGMALEGERASSILRHYYSGTKVEQASKLLMKRES